VKKKEADSEVVGTILLAHGLAMRNGDAKFLDQARGMCDNYLFAIGFVKKPPRVDAVRKLHESVYRAVAATNYLTVNRDKGVDAICAHVVRQLRDDPDLVSLRDELPTIDKVPSGKFRDEVMATHRRIATDGLSTSTRKIVRAALREFGMNARKVNSIYDFDRKSRDECKL
jgi:hypothetical protein